MKSSRMNELQEIFKEVPALRIVNDAVVKASNLIINAMNKHDLADLVIRTSYNTEGREILNDLKTLIELNETRGSK